MIWFIKNTFATFKYPQKFFVQTFGGTSFSELLMRIELTDADAPVGVIFIFLLNPPLTKEDFGGREFYAIFESFPKQKKPPKRMAYWAVDEDWTHDLFLTKEVLYPWATTATISLSGANVGNKFELAKNIGLFFIFSTLFVIYRVALMR